MHNCTLAVKRLAPLRLYAFARDHGASSGPWRMESTRRMVLTASAKLLEGCVPARMQSIQCRGEKYHEMAVGGNVRYMISTQEEQLTQTLYEATRHEISTYAAKRELMSAEGTLGGPDGGGFLSVLDIERRSHELLVQSFHLFDENLMVIKTQAIIEVVKGA